MKTSCIAKTLALAFCLMAVLSSCASTELDWGMELAIRSGDSAKVEQLLDNGIAANARAEIGGDSYLHDAGDCNLPEMPETWPRECTHIVELLITHGADVNARDEYGDTPLHDAAYYGAPVDFVELLIAHGADVNARNESGDGTPLHSAIPGGSLIVAELLLAHGADVNAREGYYDLTPLHYAALYDAGAPVDSAELLLAHGADVNARDEYGRTPLHYAARDGAPVDLVELLIAHGADVNARDEDGDTPLNVAGRHSNADAINLLTAQGAIAGTANSASSNGTKQRRGTFLGQMATVAFGELAEQALEANKAGNPSRELSQAALATGVAAIALDDMDNVGAAASRALAGANGTSSAWQPGLSKPSSPDAIVSNAIDSALATSDSVQPGNNEGTTPTTSGDNVSTAPTSSVAGSLHAAAREGNNALIERLISEGTDVNVRDRGHKNLTPLHYAAGYANCETVELLLAKGADANIRNDDGDIALHGALGTSNETFLCAKLLIEAGSDVKVRGSAGSPLFLATVMGKTELARMLIEKGADVNERYYSGQSLVTIATTLGHNETAQLLKDYGCC